MKKNTILVLCSGNSCRSQMAEALLREFGGDLFNVESAGCDPTGYVHPMAIEVMGEVAIYCLSYKMRYWQGLFHSCCDIPEVSGSLLFDSAVMDISDRTL